MIKGETDLLIYNRFHTYINSWHLNEYESTAMWHLYRRDYGIAIITTTEQMSEDLDLPFEISIEKVKYIDYEKTTHLGDSLSVLEQSPSTLFGISVSANIEKLIIEVRIGPSAPKWFSDAIEDVTQKMGFRFKVVQSTLGEDPIY